MAGAVQFAALEPPLSEHSLQVLRSQGLVTCTPVQGATIPVFMGNKDVCVQACTGSGKTLAFVLPVVERLFTSDAAFRPTDVGAVILSPTRELANQTCTVIQPFCDRRPHALVPQLLVGGTDLRSDITRCSTEGCNIVIATPGRLLDVMSRCGAALNFKALEVLVLDEADTLLDLGFHDTLTQIIARLPKQRRTGLFSATQTQEVKNLARAGLRNPAVIQVSIQFQAAAVAAATPSPAIASHALLQTTPLGLSNFYTPCESPADKLNQLCAFLCGQVAAAHAKCIVFLLTCASVDYMCKALAAPHVREAAGLPASPDFLILGLHGKMPAKKRQGTYAQFMAAEAGVMFCTDVAARGIDLPDVDWIVQYDPPQDPSFFIHRVGRTARAGRRGQALVLLLPKEEAYVELLGVRKVPIVERPRTAADADVVRIGRALQQLAVEDRDVLEKSTHAFLAYLRGYREHQCKYIFKAENLDIASLALSFGLVKLPKVEELRHLKIHYDGVQGVETSKIAYKNSVREAARQRRLIVDAERLAEERRQRDERRTVAQAQARKAAEQPHAEKRKRVHKGQHARIMEDWDSLAREERLEKRLKAGKVSKSEYKKLLTAINQELGIEEDADLVSSGEEPEARKDDSSDGGSS